MVIKTQLKKAAADTEGECKWCDKGECWTHGQIEKPERPKGKGKGRGKGKQGGVLGALMQLLGGGKGWGKGKGKRQSIVCNDMKKTGSCPRGDDCKWCKKMIEQFGTNDPNDETCWNMKMKGECKAG